MADVPCGCRVIAEAERMADAVARETMGETGRQLQAEWRCPLGGHDPCESAADLPPKCRLTLEAVGRMTGYTEPVLASCPLLVAKTPWTNRIADARFWRDKGALREFLGGDPTQVEIDAITAIDHGYARRLHAEDERRKAEAEAREREAKTPKAL